MAVRRWATTPTKSSWTEQCCWCLGAVRSSFWPIGALLTAELMAHLRRLGWHWRIRIKANFWLYRPGRHRCKVERLSLAQGQACFWHGVGITEKRYGPVHLAVARPRQGNEWWYVLSDEPTEMTTLKEYGLRFDIEENFLDDKSNGPSTGILPYLFGASPLASLLDLGHRNALSGVARYRSSQARPTPPCRCALVSGPELLEIGWNWLHLALTRGYAIITHMYLSSALDPEPAMASKSQYQRGRRALSLLNSRRLHERL